MFGFLKPAPQTLAYRAAYARCCEYQRLRYGCLAQVYEIFITQARWHWFQAPGEPYRGKTSRCMKVMLLKSY